VTETSRMWFEPPNTGVSSIRLAVCYDFRVSPREKSTKVSEPVSWRRVRAGVATAFARFNRARRRGFWYLLRAVVRFGFRAVATSSTSVMFVACPGDARDVRPLLGPAEDCVFHEDNPDDLRRWNGEDEETVARLSRALAWHGRSGACLHTVLVGGTLAGWGCSATPARLRPFDAEWLDSPGKCVSLVDFFVIPEFRDRRLYQALLAHILQGRFRSGFERAYIAANERNSPSVRAIRRVGFRPVARHRAWRFFLRWRRATTRKLQD
jgi:GNAT superfamily N-acetyltransferase